ncbi:hypothetical protein BCR37DRAFT_383525 [Protomyces lactucae-debilis]|uniref:BHLH domain-containing protein n=1 Tax=Protomyces lactucae-debilis TaxID=2754530 RepID=A0A1Y2EZ43_PROLT|nr:uncharacterized protein BCR37DRAFT_383525 [Protomyces lactucae-debilis]ORY76386.1 hypothetical protein BCR37DRAFT_383525 [Protomyces lactucae-debilis]
MAADLDPDYYASFIESMQDHATPSLTASSNGSPHSLDSHELFPAEWLNWQDIAQPNAVIQPELLSLGKRKLSVSDLDAPEQEGPIEQPRGKQGKTSHNVIEKRYRSNLNDKILDLRDAVPHLHQEAVQDPTIKQPKGRIIACATAYIKQLEATNKQLAEQNIQLTKVVTRRPSTGDRVGKLALGALAGVAALSGLQEHDGSSRTTHALGAIPIFGPTMKVAQVMLLAGALWYILSAVLPQRRKPVVQHTSLRATFTNAEEALGLGNGLALMAVLVAWVQALLNSTSVHVKALCEAQVLGADVQVSRLRILLFAMLGKQSVEVRIMQLVLLTRGILSPTTVRRLVGHLYPASPILSYDKLLSDAMQGEIARLAHGLPSVGSRAVSQAECSTPAEALITMYAALTLDKVCKKCLLERTNKLPKEISALLALPQPSDSTLRLRILLLRAILDTDHFGEAADAIRTATQEMAASQLNLFRCATILKFNKSNLLLQRQTVSTDSLELLAYFRVAEQVSTWSCADRRHKIYMVVRIWAHRWATEGTNEVEVDAAKALGKLCVSRIAGLFTADDSAYETT